LIVSRSSQRGAFHLQLQGSNTHARVTREASLPGHANCFIGTDSTKWIPHVPTFARVRYHNVYPNVDLIFYGPACGDLCFFEEVRRHRAPQPPPERDRSFPFVRHVVCWPQEHVKELCDCRFRRSPDEQQDV
jgi:hypothetical protein